MFVSKNVQAICISKFMNVWANWRYKYTPCSVSPTLDTCWYLCPKIYFLDKNFYHLLKPKLAQVMTEVSVIKRTSNALSRQNLITIYKQLVRPYLNYANIGYKQLNNNNFRQKFEGMQYNAPLNLIRLIHKEKPLHNSRSIAFIPTYRCRTIRFIQILCFLLSTYEWSKLEPENRNAKSLLCLKLVDDQQIFDIHNPTRLNFSSKSRLSFSPLNSHKFAHNFSNCLNPLSSYSLKAHPVHTVHYFKDIHSTF